MKSYSSILRLLLVFEILIVGCATPSGTIKKLEKNPWKVKTYHVEYNTAWQIMGQTLRDMGCSIYEEEKVSGVIAIGDNPSPMLSTYLVAIRLVKLDEDTTRIEETAAHHFGFVGSAPLGWKMEIFDRFEKNLSSK